MFSAAQKLEYVKGRVRRGTLLRVHPDFGPHYAVALNARWPPPDDLLLFSIATSKVAKFSPFLDSEIIRIAPGTSKCLPLPTVLDLRNVYQANLPLVVAHPNLSVEDALTPEHMDDLNHILRRSETVEQYLLDLILP